MRPRLTAIQFAIVVIGLIFLGTGGAKIAGAALVVDHLQSWGYQRWSIYAVGAIEMVAAIMILRPKTQILGTSILSLITFGAIVTHLSAAELHMLPLPLVLFAATMNWLVRLTHRPSPRSRPTRRHEGRRRAGIFFHT